VVMIHLIKDLENSYYLVKVKKGLQSWLKVNNTEEEANEQLSCVASKSQVLLTYPVTSTTCQAGFATLKHHTIHKIQ